MSVMPYPCIPCVALLMDQSVLCAARLPVPANCLAKQFATCLGVAAILPPNAMEVFSVGWSSKECACCACDPSGSKCSFPMLTRRPL